MRWEQRFCFCFTHTRTISQLVHCPAGKFHASISDDFSSVNGWIGGKLESSVVYYGSFLGRYGKGTLTNGQDTWKTFTINGQAESVTFDVHRIDSWDGEDFNAYINDVLAFSTIFRFGVSIVSASGANNGFSWSITPKDSRAPRGFGDKTDWDEQTATVSIAMPAGISTIKLGFGSNLDLNQNDESYGIDNLLISTCAGPYLC